MGNRLVVSRGRDGTGAGEGGRKCALLQKGNKKDSSGDGTVRQLDCINVNILAWVLYYGLEEERLGGN